MKKAIVTGATGFIGKFLVRELVKQNVEVIAVVRRGTKNLNTINALPVKIVECNIADYHMLPDMIADRDIDVVFHIAWQGVSDLDARNEAIQMQNLQSTLDLIDAMHIMRIGCFVFVTLSYYFNITILNVAALVIACIYAVGINWKLIKMFFAEIRKYKKEGN